MIVKVFQHRTGHAYGMARFLSIVLIAACGMFLIGSAAWASSDRSAVTCHCFQDRQFSPEHPQAFDPYLLATVQNRLMAYRFGIDRKTIVKAKMGGEQNERLWIGYTLAEATGQPLATVFESHRELGSWQAVLGHFAVDPEKLDSRFLAALVDGVDDQVLSWTAIRQALVMATGLPGQTLDEAYVAGTSSRELILVALLAVRSGKPLAEVLDERQRRPSWGSVLADDQITVEQLDRQLAKMAAGR